MENIHGHNNPFLYFLVLEC